ncbi:MAG: alpha/beta hydrolase [Prevotellaceae bacterium]|nr:alpha/beta hydrolase [Candidatus Colivivens equi]MCQ2075422.1 alpha/beta hydrolase [Bacteroidaceae bacterium]
MKRLVNVILSMCFVASTAMAQPRGFFFGPQTIQLWPDGNPEKEYVARPNDYQKRTMSEEALKGLTNASLIVYKAQNPNGICILECPGGGYTVLSDSHEGKNMSDWFNSLGITYCVLEYRMPFGFTEVPLHDAEQAMKIIRQHADEWKVKKIGVMGCSAGGHLASTLATHYSSEETRPDFQLLMYPVITMDRSFTHMGSFDNLFGQNPSQELIDKYSNEKQVTKQTPPALMILSADDNTVDPKNSIEYYYALRKAGVSASLHIYPSGGHGYGNMERIPFKREWTAEVEKWLRQFEK